MRSVQRVIIATGVVMVAGLGSVSGAVAKPKPKPSLKVAPAKPGVKTPLTVVLGGRKLSPGRPEDGEVPYFGAVLYIDSNSSDGRCAYTVKVALRRSSGGAYGATLKPRAAGPGYSRWCDGRASIEIRRYGPGWLSSRVLARRVFPVGAGKVPLPATPEVTDIPVKMTVLAGSSITASAPGRPDRSSPVTGTFRGSIPGMFKPNTDVGVNYTTGGLVPSAFPADPLCPGTTAPASFDLAATSHQTLAASGQGDTTLILNGGPSQLFGCGPAGPLTGTTTIPLSGHVGPKGLLELQLTGSVGGIPLPGGSTGGLAANLTVNVDLSGKD
jgi:hypothetical protein